MARAVDRASWLTPIRRRALRDGLWLLGLISLLAYLATFVLPLWVGRDGHAYWQAWQGATLYAAPPATPDAYLYSPLFAELIRPLALLPWPAFLAFWGILQAAVFAWLLRPLAPRWFLLACLACLPEVLEANINGLLALMVVIGFRRSSAWAFALLTKVAPGVGLLWFAVRREWRRLAAPLALAAVLAALAYLAWPAPWRAWLGLLGANAGAGGDKTLALYPRLAAAALLVAWGARGGRRWTVPVAVVLASPVLFLNTLTVLAAIPRLNQAGRVPARTPAAAARLAPGRESAPAAPAPGA